MRYILVFLFFIFLLDSAYSQGSWMWIAGTDDSPAPSGTPLIPSPNNTPGKKYAPICWTDNNANLWLYGGNDNGDALWKFDLATSEWILARGNYSKLDTGPDYGVKGVSSATNTPNTVFFGPPRWKDTDGNLWFLQGVTEPLSDFICNLWKYDISTSNWTWMWSPAGTVPNFGVLGVQSADASPHFRLGENDMSWTDKDGNFWFYSNAGYAGGDGVVWKFNPIDLEWTRMKGEAVPPIADTPIYGVLGSSSTLNTPSAFGVGSSDVWMSWQDSKNNFFIMGTRISASLDYNLEIWKLDPTNVEWTCIKIDSLPPVYFGPSITNGVFCESDSSNIGTPAEEGRCRWLDDCDNLWYISDKFWRYEQEENQYTLIAEYPDLVKGVKGSRDVNNHPKEGENGAAYWNSNKLFWLTYDGLLFNYLPDTTVASFNWEIDGCSVEFMNNSTTGCNNIKNSLWHFGDGTTSMEKNPIHQYSVSCEYEVMLIVTNCTWDVDTIIQSVNIEDCTSETCNSETSTIIIPNIFSPNNDAINDLFIFDFGSHHIDEFNCVIVNRWGMKVGEISNANEGWNGKNQLGKDCTDGVYYYTYEAKSNGITAFKGHGALQIVREIE